MSAEFPMRPLTVGEILDAGVSVMRRRPAILLVSAGLAGAEQAAFRACDARLGFGRLALTNFPGWPGRAWLDLALGMGAEGLIIAVLGALSGPAAARLLLSAPGLRFKRRPAAAAGLAVMIGLGATIAFFLGFVPWIFWFMLTGLAIPALTVEGGVTGVDGRRLGVFTAFGRGVRLASKSGVRAGRVRLLAYLPWLFVRLGLGLYGGAAVARTVGVASPTAGVVIDYVLWIAANALMYATIASIDSVALLEARMRVEGLDIAAHQARRRSQPIEPVLAATR